ncbi:cytochrome c [Aliarcobacter faecis]|uniref:c-type cytochrome n=1 Tax=Aliarcobacter faecis TaxID=1564138 RepID=UPI0004B3CC1A|nr:c-type cytochrome [Aliarcobacter faecis]QKF72985.1 cytochrome c [Aliarcobacter faecis]
MKKLAFLFVCLSSLSFAVDYNPVRGEMLSLSCANCHGTDGKSTSAIPVIAGLDKNYMYQTLLDYKAGKRVDTYMMQKHTKGFTDEELEQLSYYFSKVK